MADALNAKLIYRHPHIFSTVKVADSEEVEQNWEQLKLKEKGGNRTVLAGVPSSLPALIKSFRIQEKVANVGFDWEKREDVWAKVREEISELNSEFEKGSTSDQEAELGDAIFSLVNVARLYGINPENALERTNRKFIRRFNYIEKKASESNRDLKDMSLEEMDRYWDEAKSNEQD